MNDKSYLKLLEIIEGLYNPNCVEKLNDIDWSDMQIKATESIIAELFNFQNDTQRIGFLNSFFRRIFNNGKAYNFGLLKNKDIPRNWTKQEYEYIKNCKLVLNGLITDVSEACLDYDGIDFTKILESNLRTFPDERPDFVWYIRNVSAQETMMPTVKKDLSMSQIALKYIYENRLIDNDNARKIATNHGYTAKTSGNKLYQTYTEYIKQTNRTGDPGTKKKLENKIDLIESVIKLLLDELKQKPKDEVKILKTILEKQY